MSRTIDTKKQLIRLMFIFNVNVKVGGAYRTGHPSQIDVYTKLKKNLISTEIKIKYMFQ
jgi:hypothetical protein